MWFGIFASFVALLIVIFVWRHAFRESASPPEEANVFARIQPRPTLGASAVALEEPDNEEQ